jgi:LPS-assembly lipoprotein
MSWAERGWRAGLAALVLLPALAACQVRPLYAPGPDGVSVAAVLPAIDVAAPETRPEQQFRNALLFRLRGGDEAAPPRYRLDYRMSVVERQVAIEQFTGTPAAYQVSGKLSYVFSDASGQTVLFRDTANAVASYDRSTQEFANVRALQDAQQRVAETLAEIVSGRLAAHLATR